jgi:hypothetical protein
VQDLPNVNEHKTSEPSLYYLGYNPLNFTILANVTDANLQSVNITLWAPNNSVVLNNSNATIYEEDWYTTTNISLDQYGQWNYTIIAWDFDGYNDTVLGFIKVLNISMQMNTSIAEDSDIINVQGHISDLDGSDLANTSFCIYINYSSGSELYNCSIPWWQNDWLYRKILRIDNFIDVRFNHTLTLVNLSTSSLIEQGKMSSDCGDVRFVDSENREIPYTMETSTCDSSNTLFWVWTNLTKQANTSLYAYYGNEDALFKTDYDNPDDSLRLLMHFDKSSE